MSQPNDPDAKFIQIKLDIRIPHYPGAPQVVIQQSADAPGDHPQQPAVDVVHKVAAVDKTILVDRPRQSKFYGGTLITPSPAPHCNKVKVSGTGPADRGQICVKCEDDIDENNHAPTEVVVKVYPLGSTVPGDPSTVPHPKKTLINPGQDWTICDVEDVACGGTAHPGENMLVIWRKYPATTCPTARHNFLGCCSNETECPDCNEAEARFDVAYARFWQLAVSGFVGAGTEIFNGHWQLAEQRGSVDRLEWISGGDGVGAPRIELCGDRCGCGPWELRLRFSGVDLIYRCQRDQWNSLRANAFSSLAKAVFPEGVEIPSALEVKPG